MPQLVSLFVGLMLLFNFGERVGINPDDEFNGWLFSGLCVITTAICYLPISFLFALAKSIKQELNFGYWENDEYIYTEPELVLKKTISSSNNGVKTPIYIKYVPDRCKIFWHINYPLQAANYSQLAISKTPEDVIFADDYLMDGEIEYTKNENIYFHSNTSIGENPFNVEIYVTGFKKL